MGRPFSPYLNHSEIHLSLSLSLLKFLNSVSSSRNSLPEDFASACIQSTNQSFFNICEVDCDGRKGNTNMLVMLEDKKFTTLPALAANTETTHAIEAL